VQKNVNAAISTAQLSQTGNKWVVIKQTSTGKTYVAGTLLSQQNSL
jgi:hypothetical protein